MGEVFAAVHERLKRKVALKFVRRRKVLSPRSAERFSKEIEAAGKLNHPNIVTTYDADEFRGIPYLAMEFLEGETLQKYVSRSKRLSVNEVCRMVLQAAQGLRYIHDAGLVHCDLKPSNLWREPDGTVKVLDLGLAQIQTEEPLAPGQMGGTPDFMAPEQCDPEGSVDARADIYALGCTLFALLAQTAPFSNEKCSSIQKKMEAQRIQPLPRLAEFRKDVSPTLQKFLDRMTEKNPLRRFRTMGEVISALEILLDSNPRPRPTFGKSIFGFALIILFLVGSTLVWKISTPKPEIPASNPVETPEPEPTPDPVETPELEPMPEPVETPEPEPEPEPVEAPEPEPTPEPEPEPVETPEPEPTPEPVETPKPSVKGKYSQAWYTDPYFEKETKEAFKPSAPKKNGKTPAVLLSHDELVALWSQIGFHEDLNGSGVDPDTIRRWREITESPRKKGFSLWFVLDKEEIEKRKQSLGNAVPVEMFPLDFFWNFLKLKKYAEEGTCVYFDTKAREFNGYTPIDLKLVYFPDIRKLKEREEIIETFAGKVDIMPGTREIMYAGECSYFVAHDQTGAPLLTTGTEKAMPDVAPLSLVDEEDLTQEECNALKLYELNALYQACYEGYPLEYSNVHPIRIREWMEIRGISKEEYAEWLRKYQELQYPGSTIPKK